jgi:GAF domain-containing protein
VITDHYPAEAYAMPQTLIGRHVGAAMAEPLLYRDQLIGVLVINREGQGQGFMPHEQGLLRLLTAQSAIAIENARLYASAEERATELDTLREIGQVITAQLDLSAVLDAVAVGAMRLLGSQHAQIILWDEKRERLRFGAAVGTEAQRVRMEEFEVDRGCGRATRMSSPP